MKKLLSLALMLTVGALFAQTQNTWTFDAQTGAVGKLYGTPTAVDGFVNVDVPCADCDIEQVARPAGFGGGAENKVDIQQMGDNNGASGIQSGLGNMSLIRQDNSNFIPGGVGNLASSDQEGTDNGADIKQFGNDNTARVLQRGTDNYAKQDVGSNSAKHSEGNLTYANQKGNGNRSYQKQRYDNNEASLLQKGDNNTVIQDQSSGPDGSSGSVAWASQIGDDNKIKQVQVGSHNYATTLQSGNGNSSVEDQTTMSDDPTICNISTVNQVGNDNESCLTQESLMGNNCSLVNQLGNNNSSVVNQTAYEDATNNSCVLQNGNMNKAYVSQTGGN